MWLFTFYFVGQTFLCQNALLAKEFVYGWLMVSLRMIERKYIELQEAIRNNGGVECSQLPEAFFPEDETDNEQATFMTTVALQVCKECPIKIRCLDYAVSANEIGVWGGTTTTDRNRTRY